MMPSSQHVDRPEAVPVVFLHGIGGCARVWEPQCRSFAAGGYSPSAFDLPGHGARPPVAQMDFETLAKDVEEAIAAAGLQRPVLVGHSMGGMIVQTMLRRRPDGYRAVVLSGTSPAFGNPEGEFQKRFVADRLEPLERGQTMAEAAPAMVDAMMGPTPDAAGRQLAIECLGATPEATYRAAVQCLVAFDERANLGAIAVPVLCLAGEHDRNAPAAMMERMAGKISQARYVCLPSVGHFPNLEAPDEFDAAIFAFLEQAVVRHPLGGHAVQRPQ